ncbi:hypothetical protein TIFTF001_025174 [Ficus carica]|uniref:Uncharacterized protein n=1 Tax=Ficus carica TaxID=3494 RepID=A0AA88DH62_FICCA|nr:hypothetical protein TIFTF001_025174 [Ficus carica]
MSQSTPRREGLVEKDELSHQSGEGSGGGWRWSEKARCSKECARLKRGTGEKDDATREQHWRRVRQALSMLCEEES